MFIFDMFTFGRIPKDVPTYFSAYWVQLRRSQANLDQVKLGTSSNLNFEIILDILHDISLEMKSSEIRVQVRNQCVTKWPDTYLEYRIHRFLCVFAIPPRCSLFDYAGQM